MKVIDLLQRIAKRKEYPKIKFNNSIYEYHDKEHGYCRYAKDNVYICLDSEYYLFDILNDEVEIIEEDKKIRKIKLCYSPDIDEEIFYEDGDKPNHCILGDAGTKLLINKINEIIDYINGGTNGE